jgi:hypothetical protein
VTPESIIADATAALAVATFVLAGVTAWMARETRIAAKTATKALALEQMPILGFRNLSVEIGQPPDQPTQTITSLRVGMELFNAGRVPVKHTVKSFSVSCANQRVITGEFHSRGGRVLPGASTFYWHPVFLLEPPVTTLPVDGEVRFEYEYSDELGGQPDLAIDKLVYTISLAPSGFHVRWLNVD